MKKRIFILMCLIFLFSCKNDQPDEHPHFYDEGLSIPFFSEENLERGLKIEDWNGSDLLFQRAISNDTFVIATLNLETHLYHEYFINLGLSGSQMSFLPGNKKIIFSGYRYGNNIYSLDLLTGEIIRVTEGELPVSSSQDNAIIYMDDDIRLFNLDTEESKIINQLQFTCIQIVWSSSGQYVAFSEDNLDNDQTTISIIDLVSSTKISLLIVNGAKNLVWSPDSKLLTYTEFAPDNPCIRFFDIDQSCIVGSVCSVDAIPNQIWSPDGKYLVYNFSGWYGLDIEKLRDEGYLGTNCIDLDADN